MEKVLCFDPSGNWGREGDGTTGWALFDCSELIMWGDIKAHEFFSQEDYWAAHGNLILDIAPDILVVESYNLQGNKALAQTGSSMDTPQLIGYLRMLSWTNKVKWVFQNPQDKQRVTDPILVRMGVFEKRGNKYYCNGKSTIIHQRDAIRHGIYFFNWGKGKPDGKPRTKETTQTKTKESPARADKRKT